MEARIVKVTDKGQVSIPIAMQRALRIKNGDRVIALVENDAIVFRKATPSRLRAATSAKRIAPVQLRSPASFFGILRGSSITWNKETDGAYPKLDNY